MFKPTLSFLALALYSSAVLADGGASTDRVGYTGKLSSLDGGLGGTVTVVDSTTLSISDYTLTDASAPALYWWGTTTGQIKDGFRINNERVSEAATTNMIQIKLDAGKTSADFSTVGLWCEQLSADFGQATLEAPSGNNTSSGSASTTTAGTAATTTSASSEARNLIGSHGGVAMALIAAVGVAGWMA